MSFYDSVSQCQNSALYTLLNDVGTGALQATFLLCQLAPYSTLPIGDTRGKLQGRGQEKQHSSSCLPLFLWASPQQSSFILEVTADSNLLLPFAPFRTSLITHWPPLPWAAELSGPGWCPLLRSLSPNAVRPSSEPLGSDQPHLFPLFPNPGGWQWLHVIITSVLPQGSLFVFSETCWTNLLYSIFYAGSPCVFYFSDWPQWVLLVLTIPCSLPDPWAKS